MEFETKCCLINCPADSKAWNSKLPKGLDLEVSHHPLTMRRVVNLIIAMERLKGNESSLCTEFRDEDLLNVMLESAMEEQLVVELNSAPPCLNGEGARISGFKKTGEVQCNITDREKRSWVLLQEAMELQAMMLQGGSNHFKVLVNLSTYVNPRPSIKARPVALGIKGSNLYLSCSMVEDKPTLHLETVEDKEELRCISKDSDMVRFLFYRRDKEVDNSTLESALFTGWFISTAQQNAQPVAMCQQTAQRYTRFSVQVQA